MDRHQQQGFMTFLDTIDRELLERLVGWIVDKQGDDDWSTSQIKAVLAQA